MNNDDAEMTYRYSQKYLTENNVTHQYILNENFGPINFRPEPIDSIFVILAIKHLKNSRSPGPDEIPPKYLLESMPVTVQYLTRILNTSIVTGTFPSLWKHGLVTPVLKSGILMKQRTIVPSHFVGCI